MPSKQLKSNQIYLTRITLTTEPSGRTYSNGAKIWYLICSFHLKKFSICRKSERRFWQKSSICLSCLMKCTHQSVRSKKCQERLKKYTIDSIVFFLREISQSVSALYKSINFRKVSQWLTSSCRLLRSCKSSRKNYMTHSIYIKPSDYIIIPYLNISYILH
jgi:hypothetical protein